MSSSKYTRVSVTEQPRHDLAMDLSNASTDTLAEKGLAGHHHAADNKHSHSCEQCESTTSDSASHRHCHYSRLQQFLLRVTIGLVLLGGVLALACTAGHGGWGMEGLVSRAVDDSTSGNGSTFVHNKLYLIVVFVGLLLVVIFAVMLSAWCCRGSFENPLCCPCYLCACCGGLACLECIGCGLCAEGVDQM